ncbi:hypothetical protein [Cellulomonas endophytica]|uniref:hypothetical protein n=1 Tax=Cellulomonas endophytica TaxID=2494735 RepID=UPI001010F481|nr:hypothetical protein [Cellulomonas endophytica]
MGSSRRGRTITFLERAAAGLDTTYTDLNHELVERTGERGFLFDNPTDRAAIGHLLEPMVRENYPTRGALLSVLV